MAIQADAAVFASCLTIAVAVLAWGAWQVWRELDELDDELDRIRSFEINFEPLDTRPIELSSLTRSRACAAIPLLGSQPARPRTLVPLGN